MSANLEWPRARVRDRASAPALGWPALFGLVFGVLALRRGDPFGVFGAVSMLVFGVLQYTRPGLVGPPFRDARVFVTDRALTIDGHRIDVLRVYRSEATQGPVVVVDVRGGPATTILCPTNDDRRLLLRALGASASAPYVFAYTPWFARVPATLGMMLVLLTVLGRLVHVLPAEIGWRPLWFLNLVVFSVVLQSRFELSKTELRVGREVIPLGTVRNVHAEGSGLMDVPIWLVVAHEVGVLKVLVPGRLADAAAAAVEKAAKRARGRT